MAVVIIALLFGTFGVGYGVGYASGVKMIMHRFTEILLNDELMSKIVFWLNKYHDNPAKLYNAQL